MPPCLTKLTLMTVADHESDNYCMGSENPDLWEEKNLPEKLHS